ncbi:MAG TPA: SIMPL domain-containing protein [Chitinophagaceae bacterium]|nr:SIMPL domain-containing protein [Chitinophagaceae bacterium]
MQKNIIALILAIGFIIGIFILSGAYTYKFKQTEIISVTGAADTNFVSDLSVWTGSFSRTSFNMQEAYDALKKDEVIVMDYIQKQGLTKTEMTTSSINTEKLFNTTYDENGRQTGSTFNGYKLSESITIESKDLMKVDKISREITQLIQSGVELTSSSPNYYFTKLGDLKIGLLAKASEDGKKRAETIAQNSSSNLGDLRKATMGVFQITGQNENEDYSYGGAFNTSSINKTATITVKMDFAVD